jgi:tRNA/rRNA methyltransferase
MITLILVEPANPQNIGSVARVMKNFGFSKLVLINPKTGITEDARRFAKHAQDVLKATKVRTFKHLDTYDCLIGTTAKLGTDYNINRSPLTPKDIPKACKGNIGILIGREGEGLHNDELQKCDFVVTIPASRKYPTLNISHAVCIILYELFQAGAPDKSNSHIVPAKKEDKDILLKRINEALDRMQFATPSKRQTQKIVWKRIVGKSSLTRREAFALMGFFRKQ